MAVCVERPPNDAIIHVVARTSFETFVELCFHHHTAEPMIRGWHLSAMAHVLEEVALGIRLRQGICVPPRHLKSICASVALPAWMLGRDPSAKIICASYGQELAAKLARDFRKVITSNWYAAVFPETAASVLRNTENEVATIQGGFRYSTAVGGTVTGLGADLIVIDDIMKAGDSAYPEAREKAKRFVDETLLSRLNDKRAGRIVSIQQRLHEDDIVAHLQEKGGFHFLTLPAIAIEDEEIPLTHGRVHQRRIGDVLSPERESKVVLDRMRQEMGSRIFESQWQQNPNPPESEYADWTRIEFYDEAPHRDRLLKVVHSWDCAASTGPGADYSVGTIWGFDGASWLLLDVIRSRLAYPDLLARVRHERKAWNADVVIVENASVGAALLADLGRDMRCLSEPTHHAPNCMRLQANPKLPKADRFFTQIDRLYSGHVRMPRQASFLADLRREMTTFPNGRYDDQVDSVSQFLEFSVDNFARRMTRNERPRRHSRERPQGFLRR